MSRTYTENKGHAICWYLFVLLYKSLKSKGIYFLVERIPKSNKQFVETEQISIHLTHIYDHSIISIWTGSKSGVFKPSYIFLNGCLIIYDWLNIEKGKIDTSNIYIYMTTLFSRLEHALTVTCFD